MRPPAAGAALLAALALWAPAASAQAPSAAEGAVFVFQQACLLRLNVDQPAQAYAAGSETLGRDLRAQLPPELTLDGAEGAGCRVRYAGPQAAAVWTALSTLYDGLIRARPASCVALAGGADSLRATCTSTADPGDQNTASRSAALSIERDGPAAPAGRVSIRLANVHPTSRSQ